MDSDNKVASCSLKPHASLTLVLFVSPNFLEELRVNKNELSSCSIDPKELFNSFLAEIFILFISLLS